MRKFFLYLISFCFLGNAAAFADPAFEVLQQSMAEMQKSMQQLQFALSQQNELIQKQQIQITELSNKTLQFLPPTAIASMPVAASPQRPNMIGRWNPEIGVLGDIVGQVDSPNREDADGRDRISARALELVLGSAVDPYSRLDATIAFSDFEEASLEEAYYTHYNLPLKVTGRLGKFKPHIGKALQIHRDSLDTVDEPLVIQRYFGAEGYNKSGVDFTKNLDLPWAVTHQFNVGLLEGGNGEDGTLFGDTRRHPTLYAHLKNYLDVTASSGIELGFSYLTGASDTDMTFGTHVFGGDATYIWRYANQKHFKIQAETFAGTRHENIGDESVDSDTGVVSFPEVDDSRNFFGSYILADWRFHPQWAMGTRFDQVKLIKTASLVNTDGSDISWAAYLTFYQSEFARWRIQLNQRNLTSGKDPEYEALIQGTFAIGEHKHKIT